MKRLLLLFFILVQIGSQLKALPSIDWKRCTIDAKCYIVGRCDQLVTSRPELEEYYNLRSFDTTIDKLVNSECSIGVQLIPLSAKKVLIYMQVIGEDLENTIGLYQKEKPIVGCKMENGSVTVFDKLNLTKKGKPALYDNFSRFGEKYALCAIIIDKYDNFVKTVKAEALNTKSMLKFEPLNKAARPATVTTSPGEHLYESSSHTIYDIGPADIRACDPSAIKPAAPRQTYHVLQIKDPVRGKIDCSNYKKAHVGYEYRLFIQQGENITEPTELECDYTTKNYKDITDQADFSAYCAVETSKTCKDTFHCTHSDHQYCPEFKNGSADENAKLECDNGKWLIAGEYYVNMQPECKDDEMVQNSASFYLNLTGYMSKITEGQCFIDYDCQIKTPLEISEDVLVTNNSISCSSGQEMRVRYGNITYNGKEYTCDPNTGHWKNEKIFLEKNSRVSCEQKVAHMVAPAGMCGLNIALHIVIIVVALPIGWYILKGAAGLYDRGDHTKTMMYIMFWRLLSPKSKAQLAADIFNKLLRARSDSTVKIITGLKLIECLLQTETEDPDIWEHVYRFLTRFHGASRARGNRLTGLFARYLYLAAKKIIDKHGWISPNRVTKLQYKGYIRTVAMRLIFYCRFNHYTEEVTKFIGEGFEKLRYDAVNQYPHCGMLWSHVASSRCKLLQQRFFFDLEKISDGRILMEIPEEERFPEIGNICEQAMAAIGGSIFFEGRLHCSNNIPRMVTHGLSYVKGVMRSSHLDMGIVMRKLFAESDTSVLNILVKKEKLDDFLSSAMFVMICYGQQTEAKRMENAYLNNIIDDKTLKSMPSTARFKKIESDQQFFEKQLSKEEKGLIKWLGARMDKKELRKKGPGFENTVAMNDKKETPVLDYEPTPGLTTDESFFTALLQEPTVFPRIRTCQATEIEQQRYRALLDEIFAEDTIIAARVNFEPDVVLEVTLKLEEIIKTEPMLIEDIPAGITIVSDLHGQLYDLHRVFKADSVDGKPGYECTKYLFMGDYVDRGNMSLEIVMTLFILKILYPDRIFLLRGNHEFVYCNAQYGFFSEVTKYRYDYDHGLPLYLRINECFCYLSIAGIVGDKIFCAHAGVSMGSFNRHEMRRLEKPYLQSLDDPLVNEVTWTDPALRLKGVCYNNVRHLGFLYGEDECIHALENIGCEAIMRGHTVINTGYQIAWNRLFCLFTATANDETNKGAVAVVDENLNVHLRLFAADTTKYDVLDKFMKERGGKGKAKKDAKKSSDGWGAVLQQQPQQLPQQQQLPREETCLAGDEDEIMEKCGKGALTEGPDN